MARVSELKFVRIDRADLFNLIPRSLFEQIPDRDYEVEDLYKYMPLVLQEVVNAEGKRQPNPFVHIYAMVDSQSHIKGVLWADIDPIDKKMRVLALSVDKAYQGGAIKEAVAFLATIIAPTELKRTIDFVTTRPRAYERAGAKRSKEIILTLEVIPDGKEK